MIDEREVVAALEEVLDSGRAPSEVCVGRPELAAEVERRLRAVRGVEARIDVLFPRTPPRDGGRIADTPERLPELDGYVVESVLGRGGMGVVYRARHVRLNRPVALKMLLAGVYASAHERKRFAREAESVAGVRHPNIVQLYDVGDLDGRPYFTMELVEGGTLARALGGRPQPAREAAELLVVLADAVEYAHKCGIVHRDLKPSNILLGDGGAPKIADFGLARRLEDASVVTLSGSPLGTPSYMAPEQAAGRTRAIGPRTDVYALGAIVYEMLTGRPPFRGESAADTERRVLVDEPVAPSRLNSRVPRDLETICLKCLHKDPERRYASAAALADDARRFLRNEPIVARPAGAAERAWKWVRRRPTRAVLFGAAILAVAGAIGVATWLGSRREAHAAEARADLDVAVEHTRGSRFGEARAALERAKGRIDAAGSRELAADADRVDRDLALVAELTALRDRRDTVVGLDLNEAALDREYESTFANAGFGSPGDDPATVAERIGASPARTVLVDALDDWAQCGLVVERSAWILDVARRADPDPTWRDGVRTAARNVAPAAWNELAESASLAEQPVSVALLLAKRMQADGVDPVPYLRRLQLARPGDFWVQFVLACALSGAGSTDAIEAYRSALAIRPGSSAALNNLGTELASQQRFEESLACYERLVRVEPHAAIAHLNYGVASMMAGRNEAAVERLREATRLDPTIAAAHAALTNALWRSGKYEEARESARRALELGLAVERTHRYTTWLLEDSERRVSLRARLAGIVDGSDRPTSPAEAAEFAGYCFAERRYARAAELFASAFDAEPALAERTVHGYRTNAAEAAALLGCDAVVGAGLDDDARRAWRARARAWLHADVDAWTRAIETADDASHYDIRNRVALMRASAPLRGLREASAIDALPADERADCLAIWRNLDALAFRVEQRRR